MDVTSPVLQNKHRYTQLDSLRGLAAFCVFFSHYFLIFKIPDNWILIIRATPLGILINGNSAVMFFFVLSGFVLSLPFVGGQKQLNLAEFYIKRFFRIYPAFIGAIAFAIALKMFLYDREGAGHFTPWLGSFWTWGWNSLSKAEIVKTFILIGPTFNNDFIDPVIWSLVVEMKMSLLLPLFIFITSRSNVYVNVLAFFITLFIVYGHQAGYLYVFYLGILMAKYKDVVIAKMKSLNTTIVFALLVVSLLLYNINFEFFKPYGDTVHTFGYFWRGALTALGSCVIILIAISRNKIAESLKGQTLTFVGNISYSFYLLHLPILITLCSLLASGSLVSYVMIFLLTFVSAVLLSLLSFQFIEQPFQRMAIVISKSLNFRKKNAPDPVNQMN
ncbi:MAG: acyltransferase family protein [Mucilaginibacter sp.]